MFPHYNHSEQCAVFIFVTLFSTAKVQHYTLKPTRLASENNSHGGQLVRHVRHVCVTVFYSYSQQLQLEFQI